MTVKSAEFMVKYYDFMLDYEKDELDQLEKMYEADDLTEETEEIVLKRQRTPSSSPSSAWRTAKLSRDEMLNIALPRTTFVSRRRWIATGWPAPGRRRPSRST